MKQIDLIIFDLDGTLVDSQKDIIKAVKFSLKTLRVAEKPDAEISVFIGTGVEDLIRKSLGTSLELFKRALEIFTQYYGEHFMDTTVLYPGVKETLEHFKNKKMAVVTNKNRHIAIQTLKAFGIADYFSDILGGDDVGCRKPSSCPLDMVIQKHNAKKERAAIVGDMAIDVLAGKQAGIVTCAVTYGIGKKEDIIKAKPDFIISDIRELSGMIA